MFKSAYNDNLIKNFVNIIFNILGRIFLKDWFNYSVRKSR